MPDTSRKIASAQEPPDPYSRTVALVAEYLARRILRGHRLEQLIYDTASEFPGVKLCAFNDALAEVYARAGSDGFPAGRMQ